MEKRAANSIITNGTGYSYIKEGDTTNSFPVKLVDQVGEAVDLTGATVTWSLVNNKGRVIVDKPVEMGTETGEMRLTIDAEDQTGAGPMGAEIKVVYSDGKVEKFPAQGRYSITITPSADNLATTPVAYASIAGITAQLTEITDTFASDGDTWEV